MLSCENVIKDFGGLRALNRVSLAVNEGEILGLVGPNGSGKSTLINVIDGQYPLNGGQIQFLDTDVTRTPPHQITRMGIARTYQIPRPFSTMSVLENVAIGCMFGRDQDGLELARENALHWAEFTGLLDYKDAPIERLTLHQRKFLELARALAAKPRLLLLDEVLAGLNPTEIEESISMIRKIHESGVTIVIVEHIMHVVNTLSDRIVVLDQGSVIADGVPKDVMQDKAVINAYLGVDYA